MPGGGGLGGPMPIGGNGGRPNGGGPRNPPGGGGPRKKPGGPPPGNPMGGRMPGGPRQGAITIEARRQRQMRNRGPQKKLQILLKRTAWGHAAGFVVRAEGTSGKSKRR